MFTPFIVFLKSISGRASEFLCKVKMSLQGKGRAIKPPSEEDFQSIKLISNGAYG